MVRGRAEDSLTYMALPGKENVCRTASGWTLGRCPPTGSSDKELFSLACSVKDSSIHVVQTPPGGTRLSRLMFKGLKDQSLPTLALLLLFLRASA